MKGLELLFQLEKPKISVKQDALVLATHCFLTNEGFACTGLGDVWDENNTTLSELLPNDWNKNENVYTLRYAFDGTKYVLKIVKSDLHLLISLFEVSIQKAVGTAFLIEDFIGDISDFKTSFKNLDTFKQQMKTEVLSKKKNEKSTGTETKPDEQREIDPLRVLPHDRPRPSTAIDPDWNDPLRDPFNVGRSDLNPLARDGGGMLFDPFRGPSRFNPNPGIPGMFLPRGAIPPGARFDPFGPFPDANRQPRPHPDFMPPPDYDDMFS